MILNKESEYNALVRSIKGCNKHCRGLSPCEACDEVNLWTYWVGGRNNLNAKILLVGQDWGKKSGKEYASTMKRISDWDNPYYRERYSKTNDRLCSLFSSIGYNISQDGSSSPRPLTDLFFTNFVACYRTADSKISGGFQTEWQNNCMPHFRELIRIVQPKIVLCLGKSVYQGVCKAADLPMHISGQNYNEVIAEGARQMTISKMECTVFPLAHPGAMGTLNRCVIEKTSKRSVSQGVSLQMNDWKKIGEAIRELGI